MTNDESSKNFDLEERTAKFGEEVIKFCRKVPRSPILEYVKKKAGNQNILLEC